MFKDYQLIHVLGRSKPSTTTYAATTTVNQNGTLTSNSSANAHSAYAAGTTSSSKHNSNLVMIKITDIEELKDCKLVLNEINSTKSIRHQNILPLLNCFVKDSQIWLIYPYMYYGSCRDILNSINNLNDVENNNGGQIDIVDEQKRLCFNEQSLQIISKSILNALDYLHNKHLIHRCVCPDNIYISQNGHVYLSGLKHCVSLIEQGTLFKRLHDYPSNFEDYLNYLSPELLKQNLIGYNTKSDIYSFGVTLCELANGVNPFVGCENAQMLYEKLAGFDIGLWDRNILTSESKNLFASVCVTESPKVIASVQRRYYSEKFRNFVDLCCERNLDFRPSARQLLEHVFIKKFKQPHNIPSIFELSVMGEGLLEMQKKQQQQQGGLHKSSQLKLNSPSMTSSSYQPVVQWNF